MEDGERRKGGLHVEEDGVGEDGGDKVGQEEVCAGGLADEVEGHDGQGDAGFDVEECREGDCRDGEGGYDDGVRPYLRVRRRAVDLVLLVLDGWEKGGGEGGR